MTYRSQEVHKRPSSAHASCDTARNARTLIGSLSEGPRALDEKVDVLAAVSRGEGPIRRGRWNTTKLARQWRWILLVRRGAHAFSLPLLHVCPGLGPNGVWLEVDRFWTPAHGSLPCHRVQHCVPCCRKMSLGKCQNHCEDKSGKTIVSAPCT